MLAWRSPRYFGDGNLTEQADQHGLHQEVAEGVVERRDGNGAASGAQPTVQQAGEEDDQSHGSAEEDVTDREEGGGEHPSPADLGPQKPIGATPYPIALSLKVAAEEELLG